MPSVLIDVAEEDLQAIEKEAKANYRSRKAQLEMIIDEHCDKVRGKK